MKMKKRISALVLVIMMIAVAGIAGATSAADMAGSNPTGVIGDFETADTPETGITESILLKKEITAYNADGKDVYAPVMSYTYTIAGATADELGDSTYTITDSSDTGIHTSGTSVTVKVKPGVDGATIATDTGGVISWSNSDKLDTAAGGAPNYKDIAVNFHGVNFSAAGVYRYVITEKPGNLTDASAIADYYTEGGVTQTDGTHVRYLDVYVKPNASFTGNGSANDWDVYGYVCTYANNSAITATSNTTSNAVKTNGFVAGTDQSGNSVKADSYYTYNLTLSKTVANDAYAKANHDFPFSVIFSGSSINRSIKLDDEAGAGAKDYSTFTTPGVPSWSGVLKLKDIDGTTSNTELDGTTAVSTANNSITFVGIPAGVDAEVYETNDVTGVTYQVLTTRTNATTETATDAAVTDGTAPSSAQTQANPKPAYQSTKTVFDTTADTVITASKGAAITNTLTLISPTGVMLRVAPYLVMLAIGIALLVIFVIKRKKPTEKD